MPNCIVHLYHHALRHGESNIVLFPSPFQHQVPHNRNSLFDIQQGDSPAPPIPNDLQSICHIVLIPNIFQSAHCKCQIPCRACNTNFPCIHTSKFPFISLVSPANDTVNPASDPNAAFVRSGSRAKRSPTGRPPASGRWRAQYGRRPHTPACGGRRPSRSSL